VREMLLCTVVLYDVNGEGSVTLYNDMCLRYRVKEMLQCTFICVLGTL